MKKFKVRKIFNAFVCKVCLITNKQTWFKVYGVK